MLTDSYTALLNTKIQVTMPGSALCHSPLCKTKDKFCKSFIKQHWTAQHSFHIDEELLVPRMFYQLYYIPNGEKYNKLCKVCPVTLPLVGGVGGISASVIYLAAISKASNAVEMANWYNQHSHPDLHVFNLLFWSPAQIQVLEFAFHFYIFGYNFLRSTLLKPGNSFSLHHSLHCLGTPCHPTAKAKPTDYGTLI